MGKVDIALDTVDYEWNNYIPTREALEFVTFIQEVNDGEEDNKTPIVHTAMMEKVFNKKKRNLILCHRGIAKTTLFAEYLFLYIASFGKVPGFGKVQLAIYVSDSVENGVKNLRRNIEHRYNESEMLQTLIPNRKIVVSKDGANSLDVTSEEGYKEFKNEMANSAGKKFTDIRLEFSNYRGDKFIVKGYGAKQGVRGAKELGKRPQLAIIDDVLSDDDARSPTIIASIENTIYKAIGKALDPTRSKTVWLGTPFNQNDPIYKAADSGAWDLACYPVAQEFNASTTIEEFKGSWPDRFDYYYVKDEFETAMALGRPDDFYQELMLRVSNEDDRLIPDSDIVWFNRDLVYANKTSYNYYITTDAAVSETKTADFSVIMVWAVDSDNNWLLVDFWFGKTDLNSFLDILLDRVITWSTNLLGVGIEVSGQQAGAISVLKEKADKKHVYVPISSSNNNSLPGIRPAPGLRKYDRFLAIQPRFAMKKIRFPDDCKNDPFMIELLNELRYVTKTNTGRKIGGARHDDILDTISMMGVMTIYPPGKDMSVKQRVADEKMYTGINYFKRRAEEDAEEDADSPYDAYA